jgi:hypothetical protein
LVMLAMKIMTKMAAIMQHNFAPYLPGLLDLHDIIEPISFVWCHQSWQRILGWCNCTV